MGGEGVWVELYARCGLCASHLTSATGNRQVQMTATLVEEFPVTGEAAVSASAAATAVMVLAAVQDKNVSHFRLHRIRM